VLLVVALVVVPVLVVAGLVGAGVYVLGGHRSAGHGAVATLPSGWATTGFVVTGPDAGGRSVRDQVGRLLVARTGNHRAAYTVRPHGVRVGVPPAGRAALGRLTALSPLTTEVEFRPVLGTLAVPTGSPSPAPSASPSASAGVQEVLPSQDGKTSYQLGPVAMTGSHVRTADFQISRATGGWQVDVTLDATGARQFADLTGRLVGQQLAVVVAGAVVSAPQIQDAITGGHVQVSGDFQRSDAEGLAAAFQLGRRPVTVTTGDPD
jgi:hypothetical protein